MYLWLVPHCFESKRSDCYQPLFKLFNDQQRLNIKPFVTFIWSPFIIASGDFMLKAWWKSCGKQYQHFKALKGQCDAFNGGEKPFVQARRAVLGFEGPLDCHNPGVRLTHSWRAASKSSSSSLSSLSHGPGHRCAASLQRRETETCPQLLAHACFEVLWL